MAASSSFDVVNKVDMQEVQNAIQNANREIKTRFDFRNSIASIAWVENRIVVNADDEFKLKQVQEILRMALAGRKVSVRSLVYGKMDDGAKNSVRQSIEVVQGIPMDKAREIVKIIKNTGMKVQAQIQADQVRVSARNKDDLQKVIATLRARDLGLDLQFVNYRTQ